jgi:hypothetical protein
MLDALEDSHTSAVLVDSILCSTSEMRTESKILIKWVAWAGAIGPGYVRMRHTGARAVRDRGVMPGRIAALFLAGLAISLLGFAVSRDTDFL